MGIITSESIAHDEWWLVWFTHEECGGGFALPIGEEREPKNCPLCDIGLGGA